MSGWPGAAARRRPSAGRRDPARLLALLLVVLVAAGPGLEPFGGVPVAAAQAGTSSVPAPTVAEQRKAAELRRVARDALAERRRDDRDLDLDDSLLGLGGVVWRVLLVVLVVLAVIVGISLYRRGPRRRRRAGTTPETGGDAAGELEARAKRAEEQGEHRAAVVLWFRAGTRRLADRRRVRADGTATAGQVARESGDARVGALAVAHDRAAYGPGPVGADASRGAREGWAVVLRDPAPSAASPAAADRNAAGPTAGSAPSVGAPPTAGAGPSAGAPPTSSAGDRR